MTVTPSSFLLRVSNSFSTTSNSQTTPSTVRVARLKGTPPRRRTTRKLRPFALGVEQPPQFRLSQRGVDPCCAVRVFRRRGWHPLPLQLLSAEKLTPRNAAASFSRMYRLSICFFAAGWLPRRADTRPASLSMSSSSASAVIAGRSEPEAGSVRPRRSHAENQPRHGLPRRVSHCRD